VKPAELRDRLLVDQVLRHGEILSEIVRRGRSAMATDSTSRYASEHAVELIAGAAEKLSQTSKTTNPKGPVGATSPTAEDPRAPLRPGGRAHQRGPALGLRE
jgi:hypothetical protein